MRKLGIYFVICTLVVSLCPFHPITTYANEGESEEEENKEVLSEVENELSEDVSSKTVEYKEEEVVLFAEESDEEIEFFEDVPKQNEEAFLMIPDETEAILLISEAEEQTDSEEIDYAFIQYTYVDEQSDNQEEVTVEGYVHIDHIVLADEVSAFKKEREEQEISEDDEAASIENPDSNDNGAKNEDNDKDNSESTSENENEKTHDKNSNNEIDTKEDATTKQTEKLKETESNEDSPIESNEDKDENDKEVTSNQKSSVQLFSTTSFQTGDRHKDITQLKRDLIKVGFGGMNVNDLYGSYTAKRVKDFQTYYGLKATGIANQETQTKIKAIANSSLQEGKRHNDTIQLKKDLNKIGFGGMNINNLYGDFTAKRVSEFQKQNGLVVNGIADEVTLAKIKSLANEIFQQGDRHDKIIQLKKDLNKIGFGGMNVNDLYGSFTEQRVKQFQQYYGLKETGIADEQTRSRINSIANSPLQEGKRHPNTIQLKKDLIKIGFGGMNVNDLYGNFTAQRVSEFQKQYGLVVNGIADDVTRAKLSSVANLIFEEGDRQKNVTQMKRDLIKVGFGGMNVNDLYGSYTAKRVKDFQSYFGLKATGVADEETQAKIKSVANSVYQEGKRHNNTIQLKKNLNKIGFGGMNINDLYGNFTAQRVSEFQKHYGLVVNGIADDITRAKIASVANLIFEENDRHNNVTQMKRDLIKVGFGGMNVNDLYGSYTAKRVKDFQEYFGLKATGVADEDTQAKIKSVANSNYQEGKRHNNTIQLKKDLNKIGFGGMNVNDLYGSFTAQRVSEFQKHYGLVVNGIADDVTRAKISSVASLIFDEGDRHTNVTQMKRDLIKVGFGGMNVNDLYGSYTAKRVKDFQEYFGLKATGVADEDTQAKIKSVANSVYQEGKRHNNTIQLKKDLNTIGFGGMNVNNLYGSFTAQRVSEFQKHYGLVVNGIADDVTRAKIADVVKNGGTKPINKTEYTDYKLTLNQAVDIQLNQSAPMTDKYRNDPAYVSANYLRLTGSAKVSGSKVNIRTAPNTTGTIAFQYTAGTSITITGTATGTSISGSTLWYKISQNGKTYYIHSSLASGAQAEVTGTVNVRAGKGSSYHSFGKLQKGERVNIITQGPSWHEISYNAWREPTRADVRSYLDPSNNDKFQHLRLDSSVGVSASELNKVLSGKGILAGQGQAFINGANKHGVNEAYLIAHALLETGNGTSTLATGVQYNGRTVYNMFGIGAVDSNPINGGAKTAYENGWFTPAAAIEGGAKWIGQDYIYNAYNQNTLYKIRWNPRMSEGYAWKQYATDIGWAHKQVTQIKNIYNQLDNPSYHYDIPRYK